MSNYCACSGGDEEYIIKLNQQGPPGPKGDKGDTGFSPTISVLTSTDSQYILNIINENDSFNTPNLYGDIEKLNADLSNIPNPAIINGISLANIEGNISSIGLNRSLITTETNGNLMLTANSKDEESTVSFNYQVVVNPKEQRLELHDNEGNIKIVSTTDQQANIDIATTTTAGIVKPDGSTITVGADGTISAVQQDLSNLATKEELASTNATVTNLQTTVASNTTSIGTLREDLGNLETTVGNNSADIAALDADKLTSSNIIAGANITIDRNGNNLTINSIGGGSGGSSIDDSTISSASTWSSSKINSEITTNVNTINSTKNDNIFDINKFTVVGSPTITDDGIASDIRDGNYINIPIQDLSSNNFEIELSYTYIKSSNYINLFRCATNTYNGTFGFVLSISTDSKVYLSGIDTDTYSQIKLVEGTTYHFKLKINNTVAEVLLDGNKIIEGTWSKTIPTAYITIGLRPSALLTGQIYLNTFKIHIDEQLVFDSFMESTKPIYDKITTTNTELSTFKTDTDNNFSAVNSALNEKANLSDLAGYVTITKYNELLARVVALETEINGGNA